MFQKHTNITLAITLILALILTDIHASSHKYKTKNYNDIKKYMKTGDILLFSTDKLETNQLIKVWTSSCWTHTGIIYKSNNKLYVCEFMRKSGKSGFNIRLLDDRIKRYSGLILYKGLNKEIDNTIFTKSIRRHKDNDFTSTISYVFCFIIRSLGLCMNIQKVVYNCSGFVYNVLKDARVIGKRNVFGPIIYPCDYCDKLDFINGYDFGMSYIIGKN